MQKAQTIHYAYWNAVLFQSSKSDGHQEQHVKWTQRGWPGTLIHMNKCSRPRPPTHFTSLERQGCMGIDAVAVPKFKNGRPLTAHVNQMVWGHWFIWLQPNSVFLILQEIYIFSLYIDDLYLVNEVDCSRAEIRRQSHVTTHNFPKSIQLIIPPWPKWKLIL